MEFLHVFLLQFCNFFSLKSFFLEIYVRDPFFFSWNTTQFYQLHCTVHLLHCNHPASTMKCLFCLLFIYMKSFSGSSDSLVSACNAGDLGSIPGLGRYPGEGNGNPLQYSCLESSMDGGAW
ncbi:hypothetical protein R6Z07M_016114 [Ovis aries]